MARSSSRGPRLPHISEHAWRRMQQRGITLQDLSFLFEHGRRKKQNGGTIVYLDRAGRAALEERNERLAKAYAVLCRDETAVVTVAFRTRNLKLH